MKKSFRSDNHKRQPEQSSSQPELQESDECEIMEYYEVKDLVFAKSDKGILEPAFVAAVLNVYKQYRVQFFENSKRKTFPFH